MLEDKLQNWIEYRQARSEKVFDLLDANEIRA
jgi:hypothetical protein